MMKLFCDGCESEITEANECSGGTVNKVIGRLGGKLGSKRRGGPTMMFEVITGKDNVSNDGHWCKYCVIAAVNSLDDRPRDAHP